MLRVLQRTLVSRQLWRTPNRCLTSHWQVLELDLGQVAEVAEVSVNGAPTGITWKPPYRVDMTGLLKAGTNHLEVKVTNLWHNRIVGDLKYPDAGEFTKTNMKHKFNTDMELLRSGLIGPVVLRQKV